jgi:hypothetical protein
MVHLFLVITPLPGCKLHSVTRPRVGLGESPKPQVPSAGLSFHLGAANDAKPAAAEQPPIGDFKTPAPGVVRTERRVKEPEVKIPETGKSVRSFATPHQADEL